MSLGKWQSLVLGLIGSLMTWAVIWWFLQGTALPADRLFHAAGAAGMVGLGIGLASTACIGAAQRHLRRLTLQLQNLGTGEAATVHYQPPHALRRVAEAADQAIKIQRQRADQLASQKRELEVQLRISEAERRHAEAVLNSISDAVIVTDAFNELALANESAARVLGFSLEQALHRPVEQTITDSRLLKLIKNTRESGDAALRRHWEHRRVVGGQTAIYDVTLTCVSGALKQSPPEAAGVVTILRDVTREKEISEMKSDFVSAVSHELRTPLSSIKAYMEMLVDGEAADEQMRSEFYNIIQGETNRLSRLIDNILNISRIESGVVKVQREHISLPTLIRDVIDVMQPQARAKQIELVEIPTPVFFQVLADKDMIYQAVLNLASNAIKYTKAGGKVTVAISVDEHGHLVNVTITDNGVGVPPEALAHLFEKFYRVAEHKKMAKGSGLGLNLVKHIIETVHGGKVSVVSTVGKGSAFTFSLPMADNR